MDLFVTQNAHGNQITQLPQFQPTYPLDFIQEDAMKGGLNGS